MYEQLLIFELSPQLMKSVSCFQEFLSQIIDLIELWNRCVMDLVDAILLVQLLHLFAALPLGLEVEHAVDAFISKKSDVIIRNRAVAYVQARVADAAEFEIDSEVGVNLVDLPIDDPNLLAIEPAVLLVPPGLASVKLRILNLHSPAWLPFPLRDIAGLAFLGVIIVHYHLPFVPDLAREL